MLLAGMATTTPEPLTIGYIDDTRALPDGPAAALVIVFTCVFIVGMMIFVRKKPAANSVQPS